MSNLILTLIGIAIFAIAAISGIGYVSFESTESIAMSGRINGAISKVSSGVSEYYIYHDRYPKTILNMVPDILRSVPIISSYSYSGSEHSKVKIDADHVMSENGKSHSSICLGSNNISKVAKNAIMRSVETLGYKKAQILDKCKNGTLLTVDYSLLEQGNIEGAASSISEGDSMWVKYFYVGIPN